MVGEGQGGSSAKSSGMKMGTSGAQFVTEWRMVFALKSK